MRAVRDVETEQQLDSSGSPRKETMEGETSA
jgi:hypothetical protein